MTVQVENGNLAEALRKFKRPAYQIKTEYLKHRYFVSKRNRKRHRNKQSAGS